MLDILKGNVASNVWTMGSVGEGEKRVTVIVPIPKFGNYKPSEQVSRTAIIVKLFGRHKFYVQLRPLVGRLLIVRRFNFNTPFPVGGGCRKGGRALREAVKIHNAPQKAALSAPDRLRH